MTDHDPSGAFGRLWTPPRRVVESLGLAPLHQLGQCFLADRNLALRIAAAVGLGPGEAAVEIGPGTGSLSAALAATGAPLLLIELDAGLSRHLAGAFARPEVEVVHGDALADKRGLHPRVAGFLAEQRALGRRVVVASNLPYAISTPFCWNLLLLPGWDRAVLLVQEEFADRLRAGPGREGYGPLSVMAGLACEVRRILRVGPEVFWPRPSVGSALVELRPRPGAAPDPAFADFLAAAFAKRRKVLRSVLADVPSVPAFLAERGLSPSARAEELPPAVLLDLFRDSRRNSRG